MSYIHRAVDSVKTVVKRTAGMYESHVGDFSAHAAFLDAKLSTLSPSVIIYGVYNAGKSSLINAIIGREAAKVSDKPETAVVKSYSWGNFELIDTPGIDAPIEHEKISAEALKSADAVVFVISTNGDFDELIVASEIIKIIAAKKSLILALNRKSEFNESKGADAAKLEKLEANIRKLAAECGLSTEELNKRYYYSVVNAKSALAAKVGRDQGRNTLLLLENSGILALEELIARIIEENDEARVLANAVKYIENEIIAPIGRALNCKFEAAGGSEISECFDFINAKKKEAQTLCKNDAAKFIAMAVEGAERGERDALELCDCNLSELMAITIKNAFNESLGFVKSRFEGAADIDFEAAMHLIENHEIEVRLNEEKISKCFEGGPTANEFTQAENFNDGGQTCYCSSAGAGAAEKAIKLAGTLVKCGTGKTAGRVIVNGGIKTLGRGIKYMKDASIIGKATAKTLGKSMKFMNKMAGAAAFAIDALISIMEYSAACERDRQEKDNNKRTALAAESRKKEIRAFMESDLNAALPLRINETFAGLESILTSISKEKKMGVSALEAARAELEIINNEVRIISLMTSRA